MKILKRILVIILIIITVMCIGGYIFIRNVLQVRGVVVKVNATTILVMEKNEDLHYIGIPDNTNLQFKQGQEVVIYCRYNDGIIEQTYPDSINSEYVKKIKIIKEKSKIQIPQEILGRFYNIEENVSIIVNELSASGISFTIKDTNEYKYDYEISNTYNLSKKENNLYSSCKRVSKNNNNKKTVNYKKIDNDTTINTYNWENIYGKLGSGEYKFQTETSKNYLYITIKFTIDENGKITCEQPIGMLIK